MKNHLFILITLGFLCSCGEQHYYAENETIEEVIVETPYYSQEDQDRHFIFDNGPETYGFATAIANGRPWRASAAYEIQISGNDTLMLLGLETYDPIGLFSREVISITPLIRYKEKSYNPADLGGIHRVSDLVHNTIYCGMIIVDNGGDQAGADYGLDSIEHARVEVTHWDRQTGLIKGNFRLPLYLQRELILSGMPSRILLNEGYFECREKE